MRRPRCRALPLLLVAGAMLVAACGQSDRDRYLRSRAAVHRPTPPATAVATVPE